MQPAPAPDPPVLPPQPRRPLSLLDLSPDLLRATAFWLPPRDRLNLALASRYLFQEVWGPHAQSLLTERYPLERRHTLSLSVNVQSTPPFSKGPALRLVPQRMRQQHLSLALSHRGALVALLPYDNRLRLIDLHRRRIDADIPVEPPVYTYDLWDLANGRRHPSSPAHPAAAYTEDTGLDVDVCLEFSADDSLLLVSGRTRVTLYRRSVVAPRGASALRYHSHIALDDALVHILGSPDYTRAVGGAATLSPDASSLAWVVFSGSPASVFITFWDVAHRRCRSVCELTTIHPRRWSALGWARVGYSPNGAYCVLVVNAAKKVMRLERVGASYQRVKLSRYVLAVFDARADAAAGPSSVTSPQEAIRNIAPIRERCDWLELGADVYAQQLGTAIASLMDGLSLNVSTDTLYNRGDIPLSQRKQLAEPSLTLNSLHSCPAEATYKGLSFGAATKHPWFIIKQPMYSFHFDIAAKRVLVATSPHMNKMITLVRKKKEEGQRSANGDNVEFMVLDPPSGHGSPKEESRTPRRWRDGPGKRRNLFKMLPWRSSFATVTAFSSSGQWVAGASLLDDDRCTVCLRNVTLSEYFN